MFRLIWHTWSKDIPEVLQTAETKLQALLRGKTTLSAQEIFLQIASIHWHLSKATPFERGSAACTEVIVKGLFQACLLTAPRLAGPAKDGKGKVHMDVEALLRPEEEFRSEYLALCSQIVGNE